MNKIETAKLAAAVSVAAWDGLRGAGIRSDLFKYGGVVADRVAKVLAASGNVKFVLLAGIVRGLATRLNNQWAHEVLKDIQPRNEGPKGQPENKAPFDVPMPPETNTPPLVAEAVVEIDGVMDDDESHLDR